MKKVASDKWQVARSKWPVLLSLLATCYLLLTSCGFHLRGSAGAVLPPSLSTLRVTGAANESTLAAVRAAMTDAGAKLVESIDVPTLHVFDERTETQVATVRTTTAKAGEYTMRYAVSFRLQGPQPVETQTIQLQREYTFDPTRVLVKAQEEQTLLRDMRRDAAHQIVRRLARTLTPRQP